MGMSIADRKKARAKRKESMSQKVQESKSQTSYADDRVWSCQRDKTGKGTAVIRFLPPTDEVLTFYKEKFDYDENEAFFYINYHQHAFKGDNGKWFIEKCPTSVVNLDCPVCEANSAVVEAAGGFKEMKDGSDDKILVRNRKRKETFMANILVVSDPANPENEGQVRIFKFGRAIYKLIEAQLVPEFDDEEVCDVSDLWEGRNFKLKIVKGDGGYANYDNSKWDEQSVINGIDEDDDDALEAIMAKAHNIAEIVADTQYKPYDELKKGFLRTLDESSLPTTTIEEEKTVVDEDEESKPPKKNDAAKPKKDEVVEEDDDDAYFQSLLDD